MLKVFKTPAANESFHYRDANRQRSFPNSLSFKRIYMFSFCVV